MAGERTAAAAQARLSAAIVAGIPVAVLAVAGFTGRLGDLISGGPVGMVMVALGVGLLPQARPGSSACCEGFGLRPISALIVGAIAGLVLRRRVARWQPWAGVVAVAVVNPVAGVVAAVVVLAATWWRGRAAASRARREQRSDRTGWPRDAGWSQRRAPHRGGAAAVGGRGRGRGRRHCRAGTAPRQATGWPQPSVASTVSFGRWPRHWRAQLTGAALARR